MTADESNTYNQLPIYSKPPLKRYIVVYYNRFAQETQDFKVMAENEKDADRLFYLKYPKEQYKDCIEQITEADEHFWTEEGILEFNQKRELARKRKK